jgi:hypothetical protein
MLFSSSTLSPPGLVVDGLVLGEAVDAPVQPQVGAQRELPRQFVLAVGIQQVELRLQGVGAAQALRATLHVALPGAAARFAQRFAVMARAEAEARLDPALQHRRLAAFGVEGPAAHDAQVGGAGARAGLAGGEPGVFRLLQAKVVLHVADETRGALGGLGDVVEQRPQRLVQVGDAVDLQRRRVPLVGQAAEDRRRQVAAVDRQAGQARQRRGAVALLLVGSATNIRGNVRHRRLVGLPPEPCRNR